MVAAAGENLPMFEFPIFLLLLDSFLSEDTLQLFFGEMWRFIFVSVLKKLQVLYGSLLNKKEFFMGLERFVGWAQVL